MIQTKVQVLLMHMDKKWFFSIVLRKFNKCVPELGCSPVWSRIHHKSSVEKVLVICVVGFLPTENNF